MFMGGRRSQRPGPLPTLGSLGPFHHGHHKLWMSLRGSPFVYGVSGTPNEEVPGEIDVKVLGK